MIFNKLDVPHQWKDEFTKYPHGYTIFEALCKWVKQVDDMVDNVNNWNDYLDNFVENFEFELQEEVSNTITKWQQDGLLDDIISQALDMELDKLENKIDSLSGSLEIDPDTLIETGLETDSELLQMALDICNSEGRKRAIRLGRLYHIDETLNLGASISYKNEPYLYIRGSNGGFINAHDGFAFDGDKNAGGVFFEGVKFLGGVETHSLINGSNLIQLNFNNCDFIETYTVVESSEYLQSIRFNNCNFKSPMAYQIKAKRAYDMVLSNNIFEWGKGGFLLLNGNDPNQYDTLGVRIVNNVIEGITDDSPIKISRAGSLLIDGNYFEGNSLYDIDLSGDYTHQHLVITNNFFGNYPSSKDACVYVGKLYSGRSYNFMGNSSVKVAFLFTTNGMVNFTGGAITYNGLKIYEGLSDRYANEGVPFKSTNFRVIEKTFTDKQIHYFQEGFYHGEGTYIVNITIETEDDGFTVGSWLVQNYNSSGVQALIPLCETSSNDETTINLSIANGYINGSAEFKTVISGVLKFSTLLINK